MSPTEKPFTPGQRRTAIGPFSGAQHGARRARPIPVPWIDCANCGWRHYPSTAGGVWHIATACVSCGDALPGIADHITDETAEVSNGVEATDDDGKDRA